MPRRATVVSLTLPLVLLASTAPSFAAPPAPASFLGHAVGADRKLAGYPQITAYFEALDQASDRVQVVKLGESTLGRSMIMAVISSPENLRDAARHRDAARRLADPRGLDSTEARRLIEHGKVTVLVTCNIHSSEIGASQMAMEWAYQLATREDPATRRWLDDVILLLMPSINPDGTDMIVDYYKRFLGTPWEGGRLPWLYHHYAGHDNNRDWFMLNLVETRMVNRVLHHEWFPQVFLDEHQMGSTTPRIFVPPYADPHTPLVHPMQWRLNDLIGTTMALRLEQAGKQGVIDSYAYDAYWPGGTKNTACLKNVVGLLTEVASARIATPVYVDPNELGGGRKGLPEYKPQMNFPNPWPGGWWRLRDIVDYELIASNALLETCSSFRREILAACYEMAGDALGRGAAEPPYAYVLPAAQHDAHATAQLVDVLRENGLRAHRARGAFQSRDGRRFDAGSIVILAEQPYRAFLIEMMERQRYPEVRQGPDTKEIFRPYDVTAWSLPLLMGVECARVDARFEAELEALDATPWPAGEVVGEGSAGFAISSSTNTAARAANYLLARSVRLERALAPFEAGGRRFPAGSFVAPIAAAPLVDALVRETGVTAVRLARMPDVGRAGLRAPRLGLYKPWAASMDEGWTRLVLDRHDFKYVNLDNAALKQRGLRSRYDAIILPDMDKNVMVEGKPRSDDGAAYFEPLPPPYQGGIGKEGVQNLKEFVEQGGTLICLSAASALALEEFNLPARSVTAKMKPAEYSLPGTLVRVKLDTTHPLAFGMPEECDAYYTTGPVFATTVPGANVDRSVVGRFPAYADQVVSSGWATGTEHMAGRGALVEVGLGKGHVILFGMRPQNRAWSVGTFRLLFNAIYRGGMGS
jgi:hypothetical protein